MGDDLGSVTEELGFRIMLQKKKGKGEKRGEKIY